MSPAEIRPNPRSFDEMKALADSAMTLLLSQGVAPSPLSYTVAFEYAAGTDAGLNAAMDAQLAAGRTVDEFFLRELHGRFLAADQFSQLSGMGSDLKDLLDGLVRSIGEADQGTGAFGQTLERNLQSLVEAEAGPQTLQSIAANMLAATRLAQQSNTQLHERLEATLSETETLRGELEQHRRAALTDPLTGLWNRRAMETRLDELMAVDADTPMSVLMVDIDHFKRINDTYGHLLGDAVIRNVAEVIRKSIGESDQAVRYGGEEFVVLLPDTELEGAAKVAEAIRSRIESLRLVRRRDNFRMDPFTASVGVAARRVDDTRDTLLQRVDQALYRSKGGGRNRVSIELAA